MSMFITILEGNLTLEQFAINVTIPPQLEKTTMDITSMENQTFYRNTSFKGRKVIRKISSGILNSNLPLTPLFLFFYG